MAKAIVIRETGGPEVFSREDFDPGPLSGGEALVRQEAAGVNFIDVYHRTGLYPLPALPAVIGMEGAGVVEETGEDVPDIRPGDRVAYAGLPPGAYCEIRKIPAHRLVKVPGGIGLPQAAGMMLRGMTARYLLYGCYPVTKGTRILIHAARGRGVHRLAMGPAPGGRCHRDRRIGGKGGTGRKQRVRPCDQLQ